jgi:transcriptional regulator with XRE-family HTH domain
LEQGFNDEVRRRELAGFLRSRRSRLAPTTHGGRRRLTPGLRREEVADLAGVGPTWYTWLEQARDIRPSEVTLLHIARALRLGPAEKKYLLDLALEHALAPIPDEAPAPALLAILSSISSPAFVVGQWWDFIAYNAAANALLDLDYVPRRNSLECAFTPQFRALCPDWAQATRHWVALFRAVNARRLGHPAVVRLVSELEQCSEPFRRLWAEHEVEEETNHGRLAYLHPFVGEMHFEYELFSVLETPTLSLRVQVCDGAETAERLERLLRQQQRGEHGAEHNLWTALAPRRDPKTG